MKGKTMKRLLLIVALLFPPLLTQAQPLEIKHDHRSFGVTILGAGVTIAGVRLMFYEHNDKDSISEVILKVIGGVILTTLGIETVLNSHAIPEAYDKAMEKE